MTDTNEIMVQLKRPFAQKQIHWRAGSTNKKKNERENKNGGKPDMCLPLAYIDARDVMQRLDEVFGLNWSCCYTHADKKTICEISIVVDGEVITRANGAGDSDVEAEKGAISDAFKRAAVMFGVGQYLYDLESKWVACNDYGGILEQPFLPEWACPFLSEAELGYSLTNVGDSEDETELKAAFAEYYHKASAAQQVVLKEAYDKQKSKLEKAKK